MGWGGSPGGVGFQRESNVLKFVGGRKGTSTTAAPGWVVKASAATGPMTMKEVLLVEGAPPLTAEAVRIFGPAWLKLKSLKWAIPLPSVKRASVPVKLPLPLPSDSVIPALPRSGWLLLSKACTRTPG